MPELPDITLYVEHLERRILGATLDRTLIASPHLLRTVSPAPEAVAGRKVRGVTRVGKRIVIGLEPEAFLVLHLMIAGRLLWTDAESGTTRPAGRNGIAAFIFSTGVLTLTEAATKRRTSLHIVASAAALAELDPGGIDPLTCSSQAFADALTRERHTLKRALTDPRILSGLGNAYSDEILHRARMSPLKQTHQLSRDEIAGLLEATRAVLIEWTERLREEAGDRFPKKVTAFRKGMAVHGRYREPCPECGAPVQRIRYADHETNYCARCQTGGRLLADRAISRLLKSDWPRTLDALEETLPARPDEPSPAAPARKGTSDARSRRTGRRSRGA